MNEELLQKLYDKYNLAQTGSFDEFRNDMQFPDVQKRFFDKYNLAQTGSFDEFKSDLGYTPQQTIEAPVEPQEEAPGFFQSLVKQAKTIFGAEKEKGEILTQLQDTPVNYDEYIVKQKYEDPRSRNVWQVNQLPTEQEFSQLGIDQLKQKYGASNITNAPSRFQGTNLEALGKLFPTPSRYSVPVSSLLDEVSSLPKEQQYDAFKNLVNANLRKLRETQVSRKKELEIQSEAQTAGIPQTIGEAIKRGEFLSFAGSAIGGAAGSTAVALTQPMTGVYELGKGEILDMANKAKAEALGQTEDEFLISGGKLDSNAAVEIGSLLSASLEYAGIGKIAAPLFKNLVKQGMKTAITRGLLDIGKGAATEASTEGPQNLLEQISSQLAAGVKPTDIKIDWNSFWDSVVKGTIGGGGLTTVATVTRATADAVIKKKKIEQIDNDINRVADTGDAALNQQIDNELNIGAPVGDIGIKQPTYDQEGQVGVPSAEQQGAAPIQEGAQPEGGTAETETGGVLQVPGEAPGAQAEVTPQVPTEVTPAEQPTGQVTETGVPIERKEIEVYRGTTTGNKSEKDGVSYYTPDRNYAAFYESGTEKAQNVALQELEDLKEPTKPTQRTPISENDLLESLGDLGYKFNSASEVKNRIDELDSKQNPTSKEKTEGLDLSILYAEYDPVEVDRMNKFEQGEYEKDLAKYNKNKSELESKAKSYLSPKKLSGNFFSLGVDFSSMNPQQIFERLQSLGIATEFKGGNFLDNYHSDLVEFARKNNIDFFNGITGGIVGSLNVKPQEIIEVSKIAEQPAATEFNATTAVDEFMPMYPKGVGKTTLTRTKTGKKRGRPRSVKVTEAAEVRAVATENIADFLRGKVTSKEQVSAFVNEYNSRNPDNQIPAARAENAWKLIAPPRVQPETITEPIGKVLKRLAEERFKGRKEGVISTTKAFKERLIGSAKEAIKEYNLTPARISQILTAIQRVNLFTPGSLSRLTFKIEKLIGDQVYADKVKLVSDLQSQIKTKGKSKTALPINIEMAREFAKIDTDYLEDVAKTSAANDISLDKYIEQAEKVINSFGGKNYEQADATEINNYINNVKEIIEIKVTAELGEEQAEQVVTTGKTAGKLSPEALEQRRQDALDVQQQLKDVDFQDGYLEDYKEEVKILSDFNLQEAQEDDLLLFIRVANNLLVNEDASRLNEIKSKIQAVGNSKELNSIIKNEKPRGFTVANKELYQITQLIDVVALDNKKGAEFYRLTGIKDYIAGTARTEDVFNKKAKAVQDYIKIVDKKYRKNSLRDDSEQVKGVILTELAKYVADPTEHVEKIHSNIQESIDKMKKYESTKDIADVWEKVYAPLKDIKSANEAISYFKKNEPHVYDMWKYLKDNVWNEEFTNKTEENTKSVHGKLFTKFKNYGPTSLKVVGDPIGDVQADAQHKSNSPRPIQAGHTKEARRVLNRDQVYNSNWLSSEMYAYRETLLDIETSKYLQLFNEVTKRKEFVEVAGNDDNANLFRRNMLETDQQERRIGNAKDETYTFFSGISNIFKNVGVAGALGGLDQLALQWVATALSTATNLGPKKFHKVFAVPAKFPSTWREVLKKQDIVARGQMHSLNLNSAQWLFNKANKKTIDFIEKTANLSTKATKFALTGLNISDVNIAERSFTAYYESSLMDQGITNINLETEHLYQDEESRKKALAYASYMVSNTQVSSAQAGKGKLLKREDWAGVLRNIIIPFSGFPINSKVRFFRAMDKLRYGNSKEGAKELAALTVESATFVIVKMYILEIYYDWIRSAYEDILNAERPEEYEDEKELQRRRRALSNFMKDINPVGLITPLSNGMNNGLNYLLSETDAESYTEFMNSKDAQGPLEKVKSYRQSQFGDYGVYGVGGERVYDAVNSYLNFVDEDAVIFDTGYREEIVSKDNEYVQKLAEWKALIDFISLAGLPREFRREFNTVYRQQMKEAKKQQSEE